ncbi:hypothetical protein MPTK1_7g19190 [Marchantia polymorpha subsp. ruderalis]|uniref:Uncharacterized protein n=2 Tax=Marchantia polymorpha TaxID=3197 RepID=A0AAF6C1C5_MARPO|nr:hypothetical protein MARPO_0067s0059 [Marchantia polymorpha]PTQ35975.1 hypothetical protein MARPO_0067s0059 [Marchantia polymorpha]BBN18059.1 hypothetical protein Mp_7g19190 [Marchantia polymorpha subsp. ruderalis]BBN18060.1 hypothetical protein Mp_7g19190 [Marchantia polymorpha subsp. ruderalis]|eukprot:PTQ35974.1 hypothetical protein MARPO_0067s0059 [Marchantia polymorpha]
MEDARPSCIRSKNHATNPYCIGLSVAHSFLGDWVPTSSFLLRFSRSLNLVMFYLLPPGCYSSLSAARHSWSIFWSLLILLTPAARRLPVFLAVTACYYYSPAAYLFGLCTNSNPEETVCLPSLLNYAFRLESTSI